MALTRRAFVRTLFAASQTALATRLLSPSLLAAEPPAGALTFAVLGDWGKAGHDQETVAAQMALACQAAGAKFVISVGDNFYDFGVASVDDPLWTDRFENVYSAHSLQVPWYVILGNHDYRGTGDPEAQIKYGETHPRWIMPARYYAKTFDIDPATRADCFFIDTSPMVTAYQTSEHDMVKVRGQDVAAQLHWLDQALAASTAPWKLVFGHHPVYSSGGAHGNQPELIQRVLPLLEKHSVQVYFAGHDHDLEHLVSGKINFIVSGGGFEHREFHKVPDLQTIKPLPVSGFAMAALGPDNLQVQFIDKDGKVLHTANVTHNG